MGLARNVLNPWQPYGFFTEDEYSHTGDLLPVATILLTNRECPLQCAMCDLWRNTLAETVPLGAIPAQIDYALARVPAARQIKLYNSGSFFDRRAIPVEDYSAIAARVGSFERVIVECHPALVGARCLRFRDLIGTRLEVAMGLETAHEETLARLNKRMTLDQFREAAGFLRQNGISLRVFILIQPPFLGVREGLEWAKRSIDFAFDNGATAASLIPTRVETEAMAEFSPPSLKTIEEAVHYGIQLGKGRVFIDLWDVRLPHACQFCREARLERLRQINLTQKIPGPVHCVVCADG